MRRGFVQRDIALATIATAPATFAQVVVAGVFCAEGANLRGLLFADATDKRH